MATTTTNTPTSTLDGDGRVVFRAIGWSGYRTMLRLRGEQRFPRMTYLDGDVWLRSPLYPHELTAERFGYFVMMIAEELDLPCTPAGHTTFRRKKKRGGVEGDKTFYLSNDGRILGKKTIDLRVDPPPDLAIEVVHTNSAAPAIEVWRRFGVPEVWVYVEGRFRILIFDANGQYAESPTSLAFPFLSASEILEQISRPQVVTESDWVRTTRRWVRAVLVPRAKALAENREVEGDRA